jgi:hypothetical protein
MFRNGLSKHCIVAFVTALAASAALARADPQDDIKTAIQKLADAPNYSWTTTKTTHVGWFDSSETLEGKLQNDGLMCIQGIRRYAGFCIYIKGRKVAVKRPEGTWQTIVEATKDKDDDDNDGPNLGDFMVMALGSFPAPIKETQNSLKDLTNIQKTDDGYSADLTPDGAKRALNPVSHPSATKPDDNSVPLLVVTNAKVSLTFSIRDAMVTKIKRHETGSIIVNGINMGHIPNPGNMDDWTTTTFTNVGTTTIDVPADANAKLAS